MSNSVSVLSVNNSEFILRHSKLITPYKLKPYNIFTFIYNVNKYFQYFYSSSALFILTIKYAEKFHFVIGRMMNRLKNS